MDNMFVTEYFDWRVRRASHLDRALNLGLRKLGGTTRLDSAAVVDRLVRRVTGHAWSPVRSGVSTSVEQRINMFHLVSQIVAYEIPGDVVELGCNQGQSAVLVQKVLEDQGSDKALHLYDSFAGLPSPSAIDGRSYQEGDLVTSDEVVRRNFRRHGLREPTIHAGWFSDTLPGGLPEQIAFAHLDGDFYESILVSLEHVYPRLSTGAVCLIDDYCDPAVHPSGWNELPGVKKACDDFLADKPERVSYLYSGPYSHGYFRKR